MEQWQAIAAGDLRKRIEEKTAKIAATLMTMPLGKDNFGLMGGGPGVALFLAYYGRHAADEKYADRAFELLSETFDGVNDGFRFHSFAGGLAGIGWTVEQLVGAGLFQAETDEILAEVDPFLHSMMIQEMRRGHFDYLHGGLGIGLYFLKRSAGEILHGYLEELLDELEKSAEKDALGLKWISVLNIEKGNKGYNLSLSHGLASIISILVKLKKLGIAPEKTDRLLAGAVGFLLGNALEAGKYKARFPSWVNPEEPSYHSRLGWCYGDLGIGATLWQAAKLTSNPEWKKKAEETLSHSTHRRDLKENAVIDAGLCHGAAGIAHIFNRFYQETGEEIFRDAALYWYEKTLELAVHKDGIAGYKTWHTEKYGGWKAETGFLEGAAGIGLALLAAVTGAPPDWDEALLLS